MWNFNVKISLTGLADFVKSVLNFFNNLSPNGRISVVLFALCVCAIIYSANHKKITNVLRLEIVDSRRNKKFNILKWLHEWKKQKKIGKSKGNARKIKSRSK